MGGGSRRLLCHNLHLFLLKLGKKRTDFVGFKFIDGPSSLKLPGEPPPTPFPMKKGLAERKNETHLERRKIHHLLNPNHWLQLYSYANLLTYLYVTIVSQR